MPSWYFVSLVVDWVLLFLPANQVNPRAGFLLICCAVTSRHADSSGKKHDAGSLRAVGAGPLLGIVGS